MTDAVVGALGRILPASDEIVDVSAAAIVLGRVDAICEVRPNRADGGAVADAKTHGMHHVIEILAIALGHPEREIAESRVNIARIVKKNAADVGANQGNAQFRLVQQKGSAPDGKTCFRVAGPRLVFGEGAE